MARKRCRVRSKAKAEANAKQPAVKIQHEKESDTGDSGNDSPPIRENANKEWNDEKLTHHCRESVRAWKCYQAFALERYHWFLDKRRNSITEDYAHRIKEACLNVLSSDLTLEVVTLQTELANDLAEVDNEELIANRQFRENIKALEAGQPMDDLPLVDPYITVDQVSDFIDKYREVDLDPVENSKKVMSASFSGSISSQDSGVPVSPRKAAGSALLSDNIWGLDSDLFTGSFTVEDFYQAPCDKIMTPGQTTPWGPTGMAYDQQLTADVFSSPFPEVTSTSNHSEVTSSPAHPEVTSSPDHPEVTSSPAHPEVTSSPAHPEVISSPAHPEVTSSPAHPEVTSTPAHAAATPVPCSLEQPPQASQPSIADEDSAIKAVVYTQKLPSPAQATALSSGVTANWEDSLSHLSTEYGGTSSSLCQPPVLEETTLTQLLQPPSKALGSSAKCVHSENSVRQKDGPGKLNGSPVGIDEKLRKKPMKEPVKFSDRKSVGVKDEQLVKDISFTWSSEETVNVGEDNKNSQLDQKPKLSFAAIAKQPAKTPTKPVASSKPGLPPADSGKGLTVFSTKKPVRKFPKASCLNKTSLCWAYQQNKKCAWGSGCIYAHGKAELQSLPSWYERCNLVIGTKPAQPPHPEPCTNHYCHWRRYFLLRKTTICKSWQNQRCAKSDEECHFAHGMQDLLPLPKKKMCKMFASGKCKLKSEQCVYAHDKNELRKSKSKKKKKATAQASVGEEAVATTAISRLRTISEASTASNDTWPLVVKRERIRTISGTSCQSNSSYRSMRDLEEFDWPAWNSQADVPSDEELDFTWNEDECVICSHGFSESEPKCVLECDHDTFHQKCMAQWVQRDPTCPVCRFPIETDTLCVDEAWYLE